MADMMLFPKTWEEFEKHYGFYDSKQAYMYGNTRLIPSFRVQQWLDHIADIKNEEQSQENKVAAMNDFYKLFGKNGELITLRKEQVLAGARYIIQQYYADKQNKMEVIAQLFGKKLGEEFIVNDEYRKKMICKITERGLFFYHGSYEAWWQDSGLLSELITGEAVITNE